MRSNWYLFDMLFPQYEKYGMSVWKDVQETEDGMLIELALPGYEKEDFNLYMEDGNVMLNIKNNKLEKDFTYMMLSKFRTRDYELEQATAEYKNGIIRVKIPKEVKKALPKTTIKVS